MTYFSEALNTALRVNNSSQTLLSQRAGLELLLISQYCRGILLPDVDLLNSILEQFELAHRLKLITAYLQDHIPPEIADMVNVKTINSKYVEVHIAATHYLPENIGSDVSYLISRSKRRGS